MASICISFQFNSSPGRFPAATDTFYTEIEDRRAFRLEFVEGGGNDQVVQMLVHYLITVFHVLTSTLVASLFQSSDLYLHSC